MTQLFTRKKISLQNSYKTVQMCVRIDNDLHGSFSSICIINNSLFIINMYMKTVTKDVLC